MSSLSNDEQAENKAGTPSSWAIHPCDSQNWSNDEDQFDKLRDDKGNLLVPCPSTGSAGSGTTSGQRPISPIELVPSSDDGDGPADTTANTGASDGNGNGNNGGKFVVDGRPDGFRPGADIVSKASTSDLEREGAVTALGGSGATAAVVISAVIALIAAAFLLVARKKRSQRNGVDSDQDTLIYKAEIPASDADAAGVATTTIENSFESDDLEGNVAAAAATTSSSAGTVPIDVDDADAILADIESFGGNRLGSAAMIGAMGAVAASTADKSDSSSDDNSSKSNNNIELDPEAAAAYLAGGSVAAAAVAANRRRSSDDQQDTNDDHEDDDNDHDDNHNGDPNGLNTSIDDTIEDSYVSANSKHIGRRHSALHVTECNSGSCPGCRSLSSTSLNVGEVSFISATKVDHSADDSAMALAGGTKAWLSQMAAEESPKTDKKQVSFEMDEEAQ